MEDSPLIRLLRQSLTRGEWNALRALARPADESEYDDAVRTAIRSLPRLREQVERNRRLVEDKYHSLVDFPAGRIETILENSPRPLLEAIAHSLIEKSRAERFRNPRLCLRLAEIADQAARLLGDGDSPCDATRADLQAEAALHLADARRINSDLHGAEEALRRASELLVRGTGDRALKADFFRLEAYLCFRRGRADSARRFADQEVRLRRLLGDSEALGLALLGRGWIASWAEPIDRACRYLEEGVALVKDPEVMFVGLQALAERLARDGQGFLAWKAVCRLETISLLFDRGPHAARLRWLTGITYRALGELESAEKELRIARDALLAGEDAFRAAVIALDLASVLAARGDLAAVRELAEEARLVFVAQGLEERASAAFLAFYRAAQADEVTLGLAARVADFLVRHQYQRGLAFEDRGAE